nr:helicase-related protein [Actinocatenispora thailandica]
MTKQTAFAPGSVVVVRDEEWLVQATEATPEGTLLRVQGLSELVRDTAAAFFTSLDRVEPLDPRDAVVVADDSSHHRRARLWLEATIRKTAVPLAETELTVATQGLADALVYQRSAVAKALDPANLRPRILLADAVGLGKTLEIGMILAELVRRGRGERILVVTPRHVLEQTQHELWTRFALPFVRLDSAGIQRVRQQLPATRNPFSYFKRVIVSIDTLKSDRYQAALAKHRWDAVVIDESHNLTNRNTQNNRLARLLSHNTEALILASATPHNGRAESFAELIRLLDPSAVPPSGELNRDEVGRLVVRRHRHSPEVASVVGADWKERQPPHNVLVPATEAENAVADELEHTWLWPAGGTPPYSGRNGALFAWTLAKAFLSSPAALAETIAARRNRLAATADTAAERAALDRLTAVNEATLQAPTGKYRALVEHLREIGVGPDSPSRAVVFAERIATLDWLRRQLPADLQLPDEAVRVMHGSLSDDEQQQLVEQFKQQSSPIRVLVTGDVASEGVNLHAQCHELVHYDIPWSLIRIEQRNGRIDRYGQRQSPRITALLLDPASERFRGDVRVLSSLVRKESEAHTALGDAASLMGEYSVSDEEEKIRQVLAGQRELDEVVHSVEQASADDSLAAMFAHFAATPAAATTGSVESPTGTGLFPDDVSFLDDALHEAYVDPAEALPRGVGWRLHEAHGTAELTPPKDLVQRLAYLPQSYLADRKVTDRLLLATTPLLGKQRLAAALADKAGTTWPDAHYLAPLHPVLEWAADRALARLGRNQIFAVRGTVHEPTVLLVGTLTNRRGQVVATTWPTVAFPTGDASFAPVTPYESASDALAALGLDRSRPNTGAVDVEGLRALVPAAVDAAGQHMASVFESATRDVEQRLDAWSSRLDGWEEDADALIQREDLKRHRVGVRQERELVEAMAPDRKLVRPLIVVVPERSEPSEGEA